MAHFRHTITVRINLPQDVVFDSAATRFFESPVGHNPAILEMEKTSTGPMAVGTTGRYLSEDANGVRMENSCEVTEYAPPSRFTYRAVVRIADEQPNVQRPLN